MSQPVVAITHPADKIATFFPDTDLQRLAAVAEIRVLGSNQFDEIRERLVDVDILLGSWGMPRLVEDLLAAAPRLRAVCYAAGTVKGFVTEASYDRGVIITTAMHANAVPVAEVTVALITLANKDWFACQRTIAEGGPEGFPAARQRPHVGNFGARVGLIGYGAIARLVDRRLQDMDLEVVVYDPYLSDEGRAALAGRVVDDLLELARSCDVVSLHAPNTPETEGMLGADFFTAMADGSTFINTARGKLVDEAALAKELAAGRIEAHLDVTFPEPPEAGHPFYALPNCHLTPHRAGSSSGEVRRMGRYAIEECLRILAGEEPRYPVHREMLATMA